MAEGTLKYTIERAKDADYLVVKKVGSGLSLRFSDRGTAERYIDSIGGVLLDGAKS